MIHFANIIEAINHHEKCYNCGSLLTPNYHKEYLALNYDHGDSYDKMTPKMEINISSLMDSETDDYIIIDMLNNTINFKSIYRYDKIESIDLIGTNEVSYRCRKQELAPPRRYRGLAYEAINVGCYSCHQFDYTIQLVIDMDEKYIKQITLNSEFISWENESVVHEIRNVYTLDKTTYRKICQTKKDLRLDIPLISLNLSDPRETIQRIKKLAIFS